MVRTLFEKELNRLEDELLILGSMVEHALCQSVEMLVHRDFIGAQRLIDDDIVINDKRYQIESETLTLIATQQPMASDLRTLAAVLEIAGELERIGDYAKGIANISLMIGNQPFIKPLVDIPLMVNLARDMLHRALQAFIHRDLEAASSIPQEDDKVDGLYNQVYRELITYLMADPKVIEQVNLLLWIAHNLERAADRVTNICERVIFTITGNLVDVGSENGIESF
jgi:phosphate transport system protein